MTRGILACFASGALFGVGLAVSSMTDRHVVLGFLDVFGDWNPRLMFVMAAAVAVTAVAYRLILRRPAPAAGGEFHVPKAGAIDARLVAGAAIFGVGWGLAGVCPGPAIAGLGAGNLPLAWSLAGMLAGAFVQGRWFGGDDPGAAPAPARGA
jgi:uncharacterized membrane protein YedE/YeeE